LLHVSAAFPQPLKPRFGACLVAGLKSLCQLEFVILREAEDLLLFTLENPT
jgi:hypothetical protein